MNNVMPHRSSIGMNANLWALLLYLITTGLGWIPVVYYFAWVFPLIFFLTEKYSPFVRYHAMQATTIFICNAIARAVCDIITVAVVFSNPLGFMMGYGGGVDAGSIIGIVLSAVFTVFAVLAAIKAYQYQYNTMPLFTAFAYKLASIGHTDPQKSPFEPKPQAPPQQPYQQYGQQPQYGAPQQPVQQQTGAWQCECGTSNESNFCMQCGKPRPQPEPQQPVQQQPPQYDAQQQQYGAPQAPFGQQYDASQQPQYGEPQQQPYTEPQQPQYGAPQQPQQQYAPPQPEPQPQPEPVADTQPEAGDQVVVWICECGFSNQDGYNFCMQCGKPKPQ